MEKIRRILAVIGIILLLGLYAAAFIFAIIDDPNSMNYFLAAVVATVIVPALLWAYTFVYNILKKYYGPGKDAGHPEKTEQKDTEK